MRLAIPLAILVIPLAACAARSPQVAAGPEDPFRPGVRESIPGYSDDGFYDGGVFDMDQDDLVEN